MHNRWWQAPEKRKAYPDEAFALQSGVWARIIYPKPPHYQKPKSTLFSHLFSIKILLLIMHKQGFNSRISFSQRFGSAECVGWGRLPCAAANRIPGDRQGGRGRSRSLIFTSGFERLVSAGGVEGVVLWILIYVNIMIWFCVEDRGEVCIMRIGGKEGVYEI